jgi:hypothetical protein
MEGVAVSITAILPVQEVQLLGAVQMPLEEQEAESRVTGVELAVAA